MNNNDTTKTTETVTAKPAAEQQKPVIYSSPEVNELFSALAKAQGKFKNVQKDAKNPFFKSNYATLSAIVDMVRAPLAENGLAFMQSICGDLTGRARMNTIVTHASGLFIISSIPFTNTATKPQEIGSAITYAKRYGLQAALGVVVADAEDDDDGNVANGNKIESNF